MTKRRLLTVIIALALILPSFMVMAAPIESYRNVDSSNNVDSYTNDDEVQNNGEIASKDEVVYATLNASGEMNEIYVVNILDVTKAGTIIDFGEYESVKNLTDTSAIGQHDNTIRIEAEKGKFYYQGNMIDEVLPWDIQVLYTLDGKEIAPKELAGKSGRLQIDINTSANENVDISFYENYLLQISLVLDSDRYTDIQAMDASIANAGKNKQITFTVMPGQDGSSSLKANVANFEMQGIEIAAVPSSMSIDVPDISGMTDDMQTLTDAIRQVNRGVAELRTGVSELNSGVASLRDGSEMYQKGMEEINGSSSELINASATINESLSIMKNSVSGNSGEMDISDLKKLPEGLAQIATGLLEISNGLSLLRENYFVAYSALDGVMQGIPEYVITEEEIQGLYASGADGTVINKLVETYSAALTAKGTYTAVKEGFITVDTTLNEISGSVKEMGNKLASISKELSTSLESMDVTDSFTQLEQGLMELSANYGEFHLGLVGYTGGVSQLSNSYNDLHSGIVEVSVGTEELEAGVGELQGGTNKLAESTSDLPKQMQLEIDKMISDYDKTDYERISFVSPKNSKINNVQFVIKTESILIEKVENISLEETEEKGFWARLKKLFF